VLSVVTPQIRIIEFFKASNNKSNQSVPLTKASTVKQILFTPETFEDGPIVILNWYTATRLQGIFFKGEV